MANVSIGLPVYNGEEFIGAALDSILAQTYTDFEVVICDNASTDATEEICRSYVEKDSRISYYRNPENVGVARNFNLTYELARGKYFKWAAHDDEIAPEFLERCVQVLEEDPAVVVCFPESTVIIDDKGNVIGERLIRMKTDSSDPCTRFADIVMLDRQHGCHPVFGLIRSDALARTPLHGTYVASDNVLLAALALLGTYRTIPDKVLMVRDHPDRGTRAYDLFEMAEWFDPAKKGKVSMTRWRLFAEYTKIVGQVPLTMSERARCYCHVLRWGRVNWRRLAKREIVAAIKYRLHRLRLGTVTDSVAS